MSARTRPAQALPGPDTHGVEHTARAMPWTEIGVFLAAVVGGAGLAALGVYYSFPAAFVAIGAVVGAVVMVKRPEIGLLFVVFMVPFEDLNQALEIGPLSVIKLMSLAVFAAYAAHLIAVNRQERLVNVRQNVYIGLFFVAVLISDLVAVDPAYALDKTLKIVRMVGFYFLVLNIVRTQAQVHHVVWAMILAGFLSAAYGLYEYYVTPEVLDEMRVSGPLDDAVGFAYAMALLLPFVWYMLHRHRQRVVRVFLIVAGLAMLYGILLSGTRSGMMAAAIALALVALCHERRVLNLALIALVCVVALLVMPGNVRSRLGLSAETNKAAEASTERRLTYQEFGLQMFLADPFVGSGLGGFAESYSMSQYRFMRSEDDARRIAHNMYIEIATGTGLLGLAPFLAIFSSTLVALQRVVRAAAGHLQARTGGIGSLARMAQVSLVTFLFAGLFSSSQYDKPLWLLVGLGAAIAVVGGREVETARERAST